MSGGSARWLLIGNSRWHWASSSADSITFSDVAPAEQAVAPPLAWAAVGPVPPEAALPPERRLQLADVPLLAAPPWLGIDRALAGWQAWRERGGPVLVADAGTVLSLTRVDRSGRFAGGRLMAGLALQLRAMARGTAALPGVDQPGAHAAAASDPAEGAWPAATEAAMVEGVRRGLAAAVVAAAREAARERVPEAACESAWGTAREEVCGRGAERGRPTPGLTLVLTGGDGEALAPLIAAALEPEDPGLIQRPTLCLEGLMALRPFRPGPDP